MIHYQEPIVYAAKLLDDSQRILSQSGGAFKSFSDYVLDRGGTVYGCILDEEFKAVHKRAETTLERDKMRNSKYIQSDLLNVMKEVRQDLANGKEVLFSGTPCQIAGLRSFLSSDGLEGLSDNLYCVDFVCHGVPSPLIWEKYLEWEEKQKKEKISKVICRDKKEFGWRSHVLTIEFQDGSRLHRRVFPKIYSSNNALRPACYQCPYNSVMHPGDVTIGDFWGINKVIPEFTDEKGVSMILINNEKGKQLFEDCKKDFSYIECKTEDSPQITTMKSREVPKERDKFWKDFFNKDFGYVAKKYGYHGFFGNFRRIRKASRYVLKNEGAGGVLYKIRWKVMRLLKNRGLR